MTASTTPARDRMSRSEAAAYIGVAPQTLAVWASTGRYSLPYVRVGRKVFYRLSDLDRWLSENTVCKSPERGPDNG